MEIYSHNEYLDGGSIILQTSIGPLTIDCRLYHPAQGMLRYGRWGDIVRDSEVIKEFKEALVEYDVEERIFQKLRK